MGTDIATGLMPDGMLLDAAAAESSQDQALKHSKRRTPGYRGMLLTTAGRLVMRLGLTAAFHTRAGRRLVLPLVDGAGTSTFHVASAVLADTPVTVGLPLGSLPKFTVKTGLSGPL
jgi:hypothetical protein